MSRLTRLYLRVPRPQSVFGIISLQSATELISLALVFNKITGFYGLLAILTGYELSLLQFTTYVYSIGVLALLIHLIPHIRQQSAFECLALGWLYVIDAAVHTACTAIFGLEWYFASQLPDASEPKTTQLGNMVVEGLESMRQESRIHGKVVPQETASSMLVIVALTLVRVYFSIIVMAYARQTLQKHMQLLIVEGPGVDEMEGPYAKDLPEGTGKRGRLGRVMVSMGRGYWLDQLEMEGWAPSRALRRRSSSSATLSSEV